MTFIVATTRAVAALTLISACGGRSSSHTQGERAEGGVAGTEGSPMAPGLPPVLRGCPCASDGSFIELTSSLGETLRFTIDNLRSVGLLESCSNGARPLMALVEVSCPTLSLVFHAESSEGEFATFFAQGGYAELVRRDTVKAGDIRYANVQGLASERAISGEFDFVPWPQTERGDVAFRGSFAVCAEEGDLVINPCRNLPQGDAGAP